MDMSKALILMTQHAEDDIADSDENDKKQED